MKKLLIFLSTLCLFSCASIPSGVMGPKAEDLAQKLLSASKVENWHKNTQAVSFIFANGDFIFWDKNRDFVEVEWSSWWKKYRVQYSRKTGKHLIWVNEKPINKEDPELLEKADRKFVNHTFWLNPLFHIYSPGAERYFVEPNHLFVKFSSGGKTPGDSYLFIPQSDFLLNEMKMWVKILPFKGVSAKFRDYITTETGVKIATSHPFLFFNVRLREVKMYPKYPILSEKDRFENF